mgnify:CR=1 FL=1
MVYDDVESKDLSYLLDDNALVESPGGDSHDDTVKPDDDSDVITTSDKADAPELEPEDDGYSARVKKRISKEIGRRKESEELTAASEARNAALERELEALRADLEHVKQRNAAVDAQAAEGTLQSKLQSARKRLLQAKQDQDFEAEIDAQEALDELRAQSRELAQKNPISAEKPEPPPPRIASGTQQWLDRNQWYASQEPRHVRAARLAMEIDAELQAEGMSADTAERYQELNKRLRAALPSAAFVNDLQSPAPKRAPDAGPPVGASSADAGSRPVGAKRQFTAADLQAMQSFQIKDTPENRKIWLLNHPQAA